MERLHAARSRKGIGRWQTPPLINKVSKGDAPPANQAILCPSRDNEGIAEQGLNFQVFGGGRADDLPQNQVNGALAQFAIRTLMELQ